MYLLFIECEHERFFILLNSFLLAFQTYKAMPKDKYRPHCFHPKSFFEKVTNFVEIEEILFGSLGVVDFTSANCEKDLDITFS